ncbi:hypothetical protein EYR36_003087 [Pleurotus pulmonarius]|nr:hypothetical protein EYR36_003087 [Pleurotus pulmonarius]
MAELRDHIAEQMEKESSIVSVEEFISHYLPFEPAEDDVKKVEESLAKTEILVKVHGNLRFRAFPVPPCKIGGTYRPLDDISRAIASESVEGRTRNAFSFRVCPNTVIKSQITGSDNKVDGCFTSESPDSTTLDTYHLACILEYKFDSTQEIENNKQAVSASVQIMNDDVRRMFTYGNPRLLIKVFMSFLFATEEELGYDPMVTRDAKGDYIYRIPSTERGQQRDRFFRTTASIAEYRSNNITGRMGRVWKVVECNPTGDVLSPGEPSRVLKDVWLEDSALTESQIQSQIFADIKKFFSGTQDERYIAFQELQPSLSELEHEDAYQKYFITIVTDYEGKRTKPLFPNSQRTRKLFSAVEPLALPATSNRGGSGTPRSPEPKIPFDKRPREFAPRKPYRVVFGEVCEAVEDLRTVGEVADVLSQTVVALRLMYCAGWVHRDISSGNILAHRSSSSGGWQAKLSDLEYSRRFSFNSDHEVAGDPKTGTPYFMPHEILSSSYIVPLPPATEKPKVPLGPRAPSRVPEPPPVYNFQHDLESIWWIFLWTVTRRVSHEPSIAFGRPIFKNTMDPPAARLNFFIKAINSDFRECLLPPLQQLADTFEMLRQFMVDAYLYLYHQNTQGLAGVASFVDVHKTFDVFFTLVKQSQAAWGEIPIALDHPPIVSFADVSNSANVSKPIQPKRPRDDDAYVPDAELQRRSRKPSVKT